jgi:hypothetical protein
MIMARISAVFDDRAEAERAVTQLRNLGVREAALSLVSRQEPAGVGAAEGAGKGALAGAGVGTLFGLAAAFIPGIGPFITAGALASALGVTGGAAAAGAIVGGTSGAVAGALSRAGFSKEEADYYGGALERGSVLVTVDTDGGVPNDAVGAILSQYGGRAYSR